MIDNEILRARRKRIEPTPVHLTPFKTAQDILGALAILGAFGLCLMAVFL